MLLLVDWNSSLYDLHIEIVLNCCNYSKLQNFHASCYSHFDKSLLFGNLLPTWCREQVTQLGWSRFIPTLENVTGHSWCRFAHQYGWNVAAMQVNIHVCISPHWCHVLDKATLCLLDECTYTLAITLAAPDSGKWRFALKLFGRNSWVRTLLNTNWQRWLLAWHAQSSAQQLW